MCADSRQSFHSCGWHMKKGAWKSHIFPLGETCQLFFFCLSAAESGRKSRKKPLTQTDLTLHHRGRERACSWAGNERPTVHVPDHYSIMRLKNHVQPDRAWENMWFIQVVMCSISIFHVSLEGWEVCFQAPMTIDFPSLWVAPPEGQTHNWHITLAYWSNATQEQ